MLPENIIKELISFNYVEALASFNGYKAETVKSDFGTDMTISEVGTRNDNGRKRICDSGRELKLQIKSTTENRVLSDNNIIKYDLESKTVNDLILRKEYNKPLILILFILPNDKNKWLELTFEEMKIRKCAYWYYPDDSLIKTDNQNSIRINISKSNILINESFKQLFDRFN